ncbi:MAG: hypothetical protein KZQ76_08560 [Candidatus Thiodiazotropha sp. (ex Epidulcina cf. delphinae)]|nr:hypothetical protein [Candidatus Thiodiazotropha sp. (ex Epidulcina cf. delphinae)]
MKIKDIPQDNAGSLDGETKVIYARSDAGRIESSQTTGWEVEEIVLGLALDEIRRLARDAYQRAEAGETSPLEFHMYNQRMDVAMLAQAVGRFQWLVKRDFVPRRFAGLSPQKLERYAVVLGIDVTSLTGLPKQYD